MLAVLVLGGRGNQYFSGFPVIWHIPAQLKINQLKQQNNSAGHSCWAAKADEVAQDDREDQGETAAVDAIDARLLGLRAPEKVSLVVVCEATKPNRVVPQICSL